MRTLSGPSHEGTLSALREGSMRGSLASARTALRQYKAATKLPAMNAECLCWRATRQRAVATTRQGDARNLWRAHPNLSVIPFKAGR